MFILSRDETYDITHMFGAWGEAFSAVGPAVLLYMVVAMIAGIYGSIALGGFNFTWEGAKPKGSKMSPIQGFKRMFGMNGLVESMEPDLYQKETLGITDDVKAVKYSVLYLKAVKALQEAMTRIETLETEVQKLKDSS